MTLSIDKIYQYVFNYRLLDLAKIPEEKQQSALLAHRSRIKDEFNFITGSYLSDSFRSLLRFLKNTALEDELYGNHEADIKGNYLYLWPLEEEVKKHFEALDKEYGYCKENNEKHYQEFKKIFFACKLVADFVELNNTPDNNVAALHAYKCLTLFGNDGNKHVLAKVSQFLKQHASRYAKPLHDVLVNDISKNTFPIHLKDWQIFIEKSGVRAIHLFQQAHAIERILNKAPKDIKEAELASAQVQYKNAEQFPELAKLCVRYHVPEAIFNECLLIKPKDKDCLPDIIIEGKNLGYPGYYLVKLPLDDPSAYILGKITNCCQSIGDHSAQCVKDGLTLPKNGFYVLLKSNKENNQKILEEEKNDPERKEARPMVNGKINYDNYHIVGQGYAWLSNLGNLTFDSWENLTPSVENFVIVPLLEQFAKEVTLQDKSSILRITIGLGGKTPEPYYHKKIEYSEIIDEGIQYGDSLFQVEIYRNKEKINEINKRLKNKLGFSIPLTITSQIQAEMLEEIFYSGDNKDNYKIKFGDKFYELLCSSVCSSAESISSLTFCFYLNKSNLLTPKNFFHFKSMASYIVSHVLSILKSIYSSNPHLITQENLDKILNYPYHWNCSHPANKILEAISIFCKQTRLPLPKDALDLIFSEGRGYYPLNLAKFCAPIYNINPKLIFDNKKLLIKSQYALQYLSPIVEWICQKAPQLLSNKTINSLINNISFFSTENLPGRGSDAIIKILEIVSNINTKLVNQDLFNWISKSGIEPHEEIYEYNYLTYVADILNILGKANPLLIDKKFINRMFSIDGKDLINITKLIDTLNKFDPGLLTKKSVDYFFKNKKYTLYLNISILTLQASRPDLLTERNINYLIENIASCHPITKALIHFSEKGFSENEIYDVLRKEKNLHDYKAIDSIGSRIMRAGLFSHSSSRVNVNEGQDLDHDQLRVSVLKSKQK